MLRSTRVLAIVATLLATICDVHVAFAQAAPQGPAPAAREAPARRAVLRFLTDNDYPPFNFVDEEGALAGFHVDLARPCRHRPGSP